MRLPMSEMKEIAINLGRQHGVFISIGRCPNFEINLFHPIRQLHLNAGGTG
jgi:hypothetical protein